MTRMAQVQMARCWPALSPTMVKTVPPRSSRKARPRPSAMVRMASAGPRSQGLAARSIGNDGELSVTTATPGGQFTSYVSNTVRRVASATDFLVQDNLGSIRREARFNGAATPRDFAAYGMPVTVSGLTAANGRGYINERFDPETGLQYLHARYYDPNLGRFLPPTPGTRPSRAWISTGMPMRGMIPSMGWTHWGIVVGEASRASIPMEMRIPTLRTARLLQLRQHQAFRGPEIRAMEMVVEVAVAMAAMATEAPEVEVPRMAGRMGAGMVAGCALDHAWKIPKTLSLAQGKDFTTRWRPLTIMKRQPSTISRVCRRRIGTTGFMNRRMPCRPEWRKRHGMRQRLLQEAWSANSFRVGLGKGQSLMPYRRTCHSNLRWMQRVWGSGPSNG